MIPTRYRYPLLALILLCLILYALTYKWEDAKLYFEVFGGAWIISWILFIVLSYLLLRWKRSN